jgi:Zn-dependent peptidase ImmA (M78 family)
MPIVRRKYIRSIAERLLREHGVRSGPVSVENIARALGVVIRREPAPDDLSGFILRDDARGETVIGVNQHHALNRQRFTVGHELGHFLLHDLEPLHVDRHDVGFPAKRRDERSAEGTDVEEKEANLFAAELLMPARFLEQDIVDLGGASLLDEELVGQLARKYAVSTQALSFRLAYLGHVEL